MPTQTKTQKEAPCQFVVRFARNYFFNGRTMTGEAMGSVVPSLAAIMTYPTACGVVVSLRQMGHRDACVSQLDGKPVLPEETAPDDIRQTTEYQEVWTPRR
jgi:hypothetical protein